VAFRNYLTKTFVRQSDAPKLTVLDFIVLFDFITPTWLSFPEFEKGNNNAKFHPIGMVLFRNPHD
jgi:hypothetical protein